MALTEQQLWSAAKIDAKVQKLLRAGKDDRDILLAMTDHMHRFKDLMDRVGPEGMDQLARKFSGFYRYAKILEALASGIQSGAVKP